MSDTEEEIDDCSISLAAGMMGAMVMVEITENRKSFYTPGTHIIETNSKPEMMIDEHELDDVVRPSIRTMINNYKPPNATVVLADIEFFVTPIANKYQIRIRFEEDNTSSE